MESVWVEFSHGLVMGESQPPGTIENTAENDHPIGHNQCSRQVVSQSIF